MTTEETKNDGPAVRSSALLDVALCDICSGDGWVWQSQQVGERESDTQVMKTDCPHCQGIPECDKPPDGWWCSRVRGHAGACAVRACGFPDQCSCASEELCAHELFKAGKT